MFGNVSRRAFLGTLAAGAVAMPAIARAQQFPSKMIKLIVPYSAGGTDTQYRKLADLVKRQFGQTVIVENKPGGAGTAAIIQMARTAAPDGYTIGASTGALLRQPHLQRVDYDSLRELTWIAALGSYTFVILVKKDSPFQTLGDMIEWARKNPGKLTYATPGISSTQFIATADLAMKAGVEFLHVPYRGGSEVNTAVLGNHVMVGVNTLAGMVGLDGTEMRALACYDPVRIEAMPHIPTAKELGYDVVHTSPYGIVGPAGMDPAIVTRLQDAFISAMKDPENLALLKNLHQQVWVKPAKEYREWAVEQFERERELVTKLGLRVE